MTGAPSIRKLTAVSIEGSNAARSSANADGNGISVSGRVQKWLS